MREPLRIFIHRLAALFRRRRLEDDLDEELRSHLEMAVELNVSKGGSPEDARREALRNFGGVEQTKEFYRDASTPLTVVLTLALDPHRCFPWSVRPPW
jgi:putative ABC transport system permease protein